MIRNRMISLLAVISLGLCTELMFGQSAAETAAQQQREAARPRVLFIPYYSLSGSDESDLFLVSKVVDPVEIDISATAASGQQIYLGREILPPSRGLRMQLRQRLQGLIEGFETGMIRMDYLGDASTLQAWAVVRSNGQTFEVPFISQEKASHAEFVSFWDTGLGGKQPKIRAEYRLHNTTSNEVSFQLSIHDGTNVTEVETGKLQPRGMRAINVTKGRTIHRGWLRLTHDGASGAVIGAGVLLSHHQPLAYMPLQPTADTRKGPVFDVLRLPVDETSSLHRTPSSANIVLFNSGDSAQQVSIEIVEQSSGQLVSSHPLTVKPWNVENVDLVRLLGRPVEPGLRLRIQGSSSALAVRGSTVTSDGNVLDMSIHTATSAHRSGTYPIPDLGEFEVRTTIINLGNDTAEILAQYFWDGGTFAAPILHIPAGGSALLDPQQFISEGTKDALKRGFNADGKNMALKWSRRGGGEDLIGRTEVRPAGGADSFGFNCGGCCWEYPRGTIEPSEVEVGLGESIDFSPFAWWDTCSGTTGPWYTEPFSTEVPAPFSWDLSRLSTSDGAEEDIAFDASEWALTSDCRLVFWPFRGLGRAKACEKVHGKGYDMNLPCSEQTVQTGCEKCKECCQAQYLYTQCKGTGNEITRQEELAGCLLLCSADNVCP